MKIKFNLNIINKGIPLFIIFFLASSCIAQCFYELAKNIQNNILIKNKEIINVSWRYRLMNSSYSDTTLEYRFFYNNILSKKTYFSKKYIDIDSIYISEFISYKNSNYYINDENSNNICKRLNKNFSNYSMSNYLHLSHSYSKKIILDSNKYDYKVVHQHVGDSIIITKKKDNIVKIFFVDSSSRIRYFKEIISFNAAKFPITQTIIYDSFYYSDSIINIEPYLKLKTCPPDPKKKPNKVKEPTLEEMFLNKRFNFKPLAKHIDSNQILNSGKITVIDYSFLSCFGCVLLLKSYEKILDSFSNQIDIILIDPVDPRGKNLIINETLKEYKIYDKINYYITFDDAYETTFRNKIKSYPTLFFIDKNSIVRLIKVGVDINENVYETFKIEIEKILKL